jgi:hypothetical protein
MHQEKAKFLQVLRLMDGVLMGSDSIWRMGIISRGRPVMNLE